MTRTLQALASPYLHGLIPYSPGKPIEEVERELGIPGAVKLASDENPLGPSPRALIVRPMAGYGFPTHLRISVGTAEENARCLRALRAVLGRAPSAGSGEPPGRMPG